MWARDTAGADGREGDELRSLREQQCCCPLKWFTGDRSGFMGPSLEWPSSPYMEMQRCAQDHSRRGAILKYGERLNNPSFNLINGAQNSRCTSMTLRMLGDRAARQGVGSDEGDVIRVFPVI